MCSLSQQHRLIRLWADCLLSRLITLWSYECDSFALNDSLCCKTSLPLAPLLYLNWSLVDSLFGVLHLREHSNHGRVANQPVRFQVNSSVLRLWWESDLTLNRPRSSEGEQLCCRVWVVGSNSNGSKGRLQHLAQALRVCFIFRLSTCSSKNHCFLCSGQMDPF